MISRQSAIFADDRSNILPSLNEPKMIAISLVAQNGLKIIQMCSLGPNGLDTKLCNFKMLKNQELQQITALL